jgi:putative tryptophan/tyrosine transport system substrate-binding protein
MGRRKFISLLSGAAMWPMAARAQQPALPVVGLLNDQSLAKYAYIVAAFRRGLNEVGYIEGRNVAIEMRWGEGRNDRLPALAADLASRVAVIVAMGTPAAHAAKVATTTIPIVFYTGSDPVAGGLVASLNRPGGNLTGVFNANVELMPKRLELLHEAVPAAKTVALLVNPANPTLAEPATSKLLTAASTLGLQLHVLQAGTEREIDAAFETLVKLQAGALVIGTDAFFVSRIENLAEHRRLYRANSQRRKAG